MGCAATQRGGRAAAGVPSQPALVPPGRGQLHSSTAELGRGRRMDGLPPLPPPPASTRRCSDTFLGVWETSPGGNQESRAKVRGGLKAG